MFPQPKSLVQHLTHYECGSIIKKGIKEPYTRYNLFKAPHEHTYQGYSNKFEEYSKELKRKGQDITFMRLLTFFKTENLLMNFFGISCNAIDYIIPIIMERFLRWINEVDSPTIEGFWVLSVAIGLILLRVAFNNLFMYYLLVKIKSKIFFKFFFNFSNFFS